MKTLKDYLKEQETSTNSDVGVSLSEYAVEPKNKEDKEAKLKALQALLVDPNTANDPQLQQVIKARLAQLQTDESVEPVKEDPTPKRRIMDFDNHSRYWSGTGEYQDAYGDLYDQLVPKQGKADTVEGELLRAVGKIIYRHGNDGDNFSNSSYEWIEKHVGKFDHLDDMADKVVLYVLNKKGDYTPNNFDWLTVADYGPGEYEKDWEQVGCNNCGGTGEIAYTNDDGEEDFEECDACDGNGWIEQTTESVETVTEDYKGWTYSKEVEEYDDNRKIFHSATKDGKEVSMDWSPYSTPTAEEFKLWIDLGMPTRKDVNSIGPLDKDDLLTLAKTKQGTHDLLKRELDEIKRLSGLPVNEDKNDVMGKLDTKTRIQLQKAKQKYQALAKGDPLASMLMDLEREVDRLDQENDIEDAQIAAQDIVDKMHTDAIAKLKKKTTHEAFQYHLDNNIPIRENIFRPGSDKYFELFNYARKQFQEGKFTPDWEDQELLETDIGQVVKLVNGHSVPLDQPFADDELSEAEYQGKKVELNKPKRGGPKKFYVYVKNPKTGKVKKVSWGDTTGLSVKASKPGRVKSFVARHKCKQKNDKTKAGYWACRTPRYKSLGVKGGQWW